MAIGSRRLTVRTVEGPRLGQERLEALLIKANDDVLINLRDRCRHVAELRELVEGLLIARDVALGVCHALP